MFTLRSSLMVLGLSSAALADVTSVKELQFQATGPAGFRINGQTNRLESINEGDSIVLRVPLDSVDTGIELRNSHMKEKYLETGRFPFAELRISKALLKEGKGQRGLGTFTVHGQSKEVTISYDATRVAGALEVQGVFNINLKNHAIDVPNYLGVTVKPEVKVVATFSIVP